MSCLQLRKERLSYENIKTLATKYAAAQNIEVYLFKNQDGTYGFTSIEEGDISGAIEFISPSMSDAS